MTKKKCILQKVCDNMLYDVLSFRQSDENVEC